MNRIISGRLSKDLLRKNNFDRLFKFYRMENGKFGFHLRTTDHYGHLVSFNELSKFFFALLFLIRSKPGSVL